MDTNSATPRRSQQIQNAASSSPSSSSNKTPEETPSPKITKMTTRRRSPFLPTWIESSLLAIYPATLVFGSLFSLINPSARIAPYSVLTQSHPENVAPSYFAKKSNLFNQLFVKQGWAWITASFFFFLFTHPSFGAPNSLTITPRRVRGALRWMILTVWWFLVTQWCFGPAIIDRGFLLTGGQCDLVQAAEEGKVDMDRSRQLVTHVACKAVGGKWKDGHDISGHVFLLVLGSMFLLEEVLHVLLRASMAKEERTIVMGDGAVKSAELEAQPDDEKAVSVERWMLGTRVAMGVAGLSVFMLAMTAIYFHTWFEKLEGLLVAFGGIFVVYFLPRMIPPMRSVFGLPGI